MLPFAFALALAFALLRFIIMSPSVVAHAQNVGVGTAPFLEGGVLR